MATELNWLENLMQGCIEVPEVRREFLEYLCEEVYRAYLELLKNGVRDVVIFVGSSKSPEWIAVSRCVLTRNLAISIEVYSEGTLEGSRLRGLCSTVRRIGVPVAPPTSQLSERR